MHHQLYLILGVLVAPAVIVVLTFAGLDLKYRYSVKSGLPKESDVER